MTTTHDIAALLAAIDSGDDSALPILADALEEQGDRRADGLRLLPTLQKAVREASTIQPDYTPVVATGDGAPLPDGSGAYLAVSPGEAILYESAGDCAASVSPEIFRRLPGPPRDYYLRNGGHRYVIGSPCGMIFPSLSAAYLALAEALSQE